MKKIILMVLLGFSLVVSATSTEKNISTNNLLDTIIVTAPAAGTVWVKGVTKTITWTKTGTLDANVKIQLFKGKSNILDITLKTKNTGVYDWTIPKTLNNGFYTIAITTLDGKVKSKNVSLNITDGLIQVTQPEAGVKWINGTPQEIAWVSEGAVNNKVKIQLYEGATKVLDIADNVPTASGKFTWNIPMTSTYSIHVIAMDNLVKAKSGFFSLPASVVPITKSSLEVEVWKGIWTVKPVMKIIDNEKQWQASAEQNYGIALRLKPKSSFSLGFVYQKIQGKYSYSDQEYNEYYPYEIYWYNNNQSVKLVNDTREESGNVDIAGDMAFMDLRWEIAPNWRIHPYFAFGFGVIFNKITGNTHHVFWGVDTKGNRIDLEEGDEPGDLSDLPSALPVLELKFGLKIEIIKKKLAIGIEGGFLDGVVYAGTLSFRF